MSYIKDIPEITPLFKGANYIDIKVVKGETSLRQFLASMLSYYPRWVLFLYRIRAILVKLLGLVKHPTPETLPELVAADVSFVPGEAVTFLTVRTAKDEHYWVGETPEDKHLKAYLGVAVEPMVDNRRRFHVATIVHYLHWSGPVYFNLIRPFHHLVVWKMIQAGLGPKIR